MLWTIEAIRQRNTQAGYFWFSAETMAFWKTRLGKTVYSGRGGIFFVSSDIFWDDIRTYTVRKFDPYTGEVETTHDEATRLANAKEARNAAVVLACGNEQDILDYFGEEK